MQEDLRPDIDFWPSCVCMHVHLPIYIHARKHMGACKQRDREEEEKSGGVKKNQQLQIRLILK